MHVRILRLKPIGNELETKANRPAINVNEYPTITK